VVLITFGWLRGRACYLGPEVKLKRRLFLFFPCLGFAQPATMHEQVEQWMRDFDSVVDRAASLKVADISTCLQAVRLAVLANSADKLADFLGPIAEKGRSLGLDKTHISDR